MYIYTRLVKERDEACAKVLRALPRSDVRVVEPRVAEENMQQAAPASIPTAARAVAITVYIPQVYIRLGYKGYL